MKRSMQWVRGARTVHGSFSNLKRMVIHESMGMFVGLCKEICTKHISHDNGNDVSVMFVKSGYVKDFLLLLSVCVVKGQFIRE